VASRDGVRKSVLRHVMRTFFDDSPAELVAALVARPGRKIRPVEKKRLRELLEALERQEKREKRS